MAVKASLNAGLPIVYPDGTMQPHFRDFQFKVDEAVGEAGLNSVWGNVAGSLSSQADLVAALAGKANVSHTHLATDITSVPENESGASYTVVSSDAGKVKRFTGASPAVTIPTGVLTTGETVSIRQAGSGTLALTTTGLTINGTIPAWSQHVEVRLRCVGTDELDVI